MFCKHPVPGFSHPSHSLSLKAGTLHWCHGLSRHCTGTYKLQSHGHLGQLTKQENLGTVLWPPCTPWSCAEHLPLKCQKHLQWYSCSSMEHRPSGRRFSTVSLSVSWENRGPWRSTKVTFKGEEPPGKVLTRMLSLQQALVDRQATARNFTGLQMDTSYHLQQYWDCYQKNLYLIPNPLSITA